MILFNLIILVPNAKKHKQNAQFTFVINEG